MHLADRKIVEVEAEVRRDVGVGRLFVGQDNVQPDRRCTDIDRSAIARFHHARPTSGDNNKFLAVAAQAFFPDQTGKLARFVIVFRQIGQCLGARFVPMLRVGNAGAAKEHNRRCDPGIAHPKLGLEQLELQPDGPQGFATQEVAILERQPIRGRPGLCRIRRLLNLLSVLPCRAKDRKPFLCHACPQTSLPRCDCAGVHNCL